VTRLSVLTVDDEAPALDELTYLLDHCPRVDSVVAVPSATEALRLLQERPFDVVFLDIRMPGLDGMELAKVLTRFSRPPALVFVTAHNEHALEAFEVGASGYLLKPVNHDQLLQVLDRAVPPNGGPAEPHEALDVLPAESGNAVIMVARDEVKWAASAGDYVRLHTVDGATHLVRIPISVLEDQWTAYGFARIHRSYLVALREIRELRVDGTQMTVRIGDQDLPVSRRHVHELRDRLVRNARRNTR
jgi:DNA-binding LytR/AlgR family response regulator